MSILVTGGAGFIGSHLVERLLADGRSVICVDNFNDYYDPRIKRRNIALLPDNPLFSLCEVDIRDGAAMGDIFSGNDIEIVVHLAARAGVRPSIIDPVLYSEVDVEGTVRLLELCRKSGVKRFLFGSSSSVYGANEKVPFSEDDRVDSPLSPYAAAKRAGELFCSMYHRVHGLAVCCMRFFTVYGPRQRPDMAIHKFTRLISEGKPISIYGDGTSSRDYTYVDDIIDGVVEAMDYDFGCEIFNLGDSRIVELSEMIKLIESKLGREARIERLPDQPGDVPRTYADISKARKLLGYEPKVPIEEGIARFVNWFSK
ncbi:MAG: GDP-mannose 4,6-dehydratase [Candidatus Tritonobacter lacicola]|nr:GDP-mannose 4,6-dehydratase [Candidatus Tritonobacter lacicola]